VRGPDRDNRGVKGGGGDATVELESRRRFPEVARCHYNGDPRRYSLANGPTHRIGDPGFSCRTGETHVHHVDVLRSAVLNHPVDAGYYIADLPKPKPIEHPHVDEICGRCDPVESARRSAADIAARVYSCYVCPVPVCVFVSRNQRQVQCEQVLEAAKEVV